MSNHTTHKDTLIDQGQEAAEYIRQYVHQSTELLKLEATEKVATGMASLVYIIVILLLSLSTLAFIFTSGAIYIASVTDSLLIGFGSVALLNIVILIAILTFGRKMIITPLINVVIKAIMN